jgi:hypothetical protein
VPFLDDAGTAAAVEGGAAQGVASSEANSVPLSQPASGRSRWLDQDEDRVPPFSFQLLLHKLLLLRLPAPHHVLLKVAPPDICLATSGKFHSGTPCQALYRPGHARLFACGDS